MCNAKAKTSEHKKYKLKVKVVLRRYQGRGQHCFGVIIIMQTVVESNSQLLYYKLIKYKLITLSTLITGE